MSKYRNTKVLTVVLNYSDGFLQTKNLNLPFVADQVKVKSITVSNCNYIFMNSFPVLLCDFTDPNQALATYTNVFPNQTIYTQAQAFQCKFQGSDYGKSVRFHLRMLDSTGFVNAPMTSGSLVVSLEFKKTT